MAGQVSEPDPVSSHLAFITTNSAPPVTLLPSGTFVVCGTRSRVLFDWTANVSYVTEDFVHRTKAKTFKCERPFVGLNQQVSLSQSVAVLQVECGKTITVVEASVIPRIATLPAVEDVPYRGWSLVETKVHRLRDTYPRGEVEIQVMLSQNVLPQLMHPNCTGKVWKRSLTASFLTDGSIVLHGLLPDRLSAEHDRTHVSKSMLTQMDLEDKLIHQLITLENIGISSNEIEDNFTSKEATQQLFEELTTYDEEKRQYETAILWKKNCPQLGGSLNKAIARWLQQERKFAKDKVAEETYRTTMLKFLERGDVRWIPPDELGEDVDCFWLPHSSVLKPGESEPRVVFDGAASDGEGRVINDQIREAPKNTASIHKILLCAREEEILVSCDVSKMYMSVNLRKEDHRYVRFVWRAHPDDPLGFFHFVKTPWGLADSSFKAIQILSQHAERHKETSPLAVNAIQQFTYVDDVVVSLKKSSKNVKVIDDINAITSEAGFKLRKWTCSDPSLIEHLPIEDRRADPVVTLEGQDPTIKTLGLHWNSRDDSILFRSQDALIQKIENLHDAAITKRVLASACGTIFDPLGLVSYCTIVVKLLMVESWAHPGTWKTPVSSDLVAKFRQWISRIGILSSVSFPRFIRKHDALVKRKEYIVITDASPQAACACVYLYSEYKDNTYTCRLVMSKTRVAPHTKSEDSTGKKVRKTLTLPRMELFGCLLGCRLVEFVANETGNTHIPRRFLSDSTVALHWITSKDPENLKTWTKNRVVECQAMSLEPSWFHIPGLNNPSDLGTRDSLFEKLNQRDVQRWAEGPQDWEDWDAFRTHVLPPFIESPIASAQPEDSAIIESEVCKKPKVVLVTVSHPLIELATPLKALLNKVSSYGKLIRITALVLKARKPFQTDQESLTRSSFLQLLENTKDTAVGRAAAKIPTQTLLELRDASLMWWRIAQFETPGVDKWEGCYFDTKSQLYRLVGRFDKNALLIPFEQRHQIAIPKGHRVTRLYIEWLHSCHLHASPERVLGYLRQMLWIMPNRSLATVQAALRKIPCCMKFKAKISQAPLGDLDPDRLISGVCWETIGIDTAGPLPIRLHPVKLRNIKSFELGDYLRRPQKKHSPFAVTKFDGGEPTTTCHILLVTCLSTRAVHLEVLDNLTLDVVGMGLLKTFARRGWPSRILSDNHKTFLSLQRDERFRQLGIQWDPIPERAPWVGGIWERLVAPVKNTLKRMMRCASVTKQEMEYLVSQAESVINDRPLSASLESPMEEGRITPSLLIQNRKLRDHPPPPLPNTIPVLRSHQEARCRNRHRQQLQKSFWNCWRRQYLQALQKRGKTFHSKTTTQLSVGQVVLINDTPAPRNMWRLGRIVELKATRSVKPNESAPIPRSALIRTSEGLIRRSVRSIAPMECEENPHILQE